MPKHALPDERNYSKMLVIFLLNFWIFCFSLRAALATPQIQDIRIVTKRLMLVNKKLDIKGFSRMVQCVAASEARKGGVHRGTVTADSI
jgi:hypothetical protein